MNRHLDPAKDVLSDLRKKIDKENKRSVFGQLQADAYCWIFASPNYFLLQGNPYKKLPRHSSAIHLKALPLYEEWFHQDHYLQEVEPQIISAPGSRTSLGKYLRDLHRKSYKTLQWPQRWEMSLKSFIQFLRKKLPARDASFLDMFFPEEMYLSEKGIISNVSKTTRRITVNECGTVLKALADLVFQGNPTSQHCAAEALALSWLCLTKARIRHPSQVKLIHEVLYSSLSFTKKGKRDLYKTDCEIFTAPTLRGTFQIPISTHLFAFLNALAATPSKSEPIFQSPLRSLRRTLTSVLEKMPQNFHEITFQSLLHFVNDSDSLQEK